MPEAEIPKMTKKNVETLALPRDPEKLKMMILSGELKPSSEVAEAFRKVHEIARRRVKPGSHEVEKFIADRRKGLV